MKLRDYQERISKECHQKLVKYGFCYLALEVRLGKTLTALAACGLVEAKEVLFVTKKKAISSIQGDYSNFGFDYNITIVNYESLHKIEATKWDVVILDEAHSMGAIAKPSLRAKQVKALLLKYGSKVILLSGTPTPESFSQMYHQVYGIKGNPFSEFKNFYRFCDKHVDVTERKINGFNIKDYSGGRQSIIDAMKPYTINFSQAEAGFKVDTKEHKLYVEMSQMTYAIADKLKKDLVVEGQNEVILADTSVKLMTKLHQIYSGTVKFESGNSAIIDLSKAQFIYDNFSLVKIGIFYKFKEELNALKQVYGDSLCTELEEFNNTKKTIALQIVSGREGISLRNAVALIYYNIDFSATSYWQSRDRMTTKERLTSDVYWVFAKGGIEDSIYKAVMQKQNFTLAHFKRTL